MIWNALINGEIGLFTNATNQEKDEDIANKKDSVDLFTFDGKRDNNNLIRENHLDHGDTEPLAVPMKMVDCRSEHLQIRDCIGGMDPPENVDGLEDDKASHLEIGLLEADLDKEDEAHLNAWDTQWDRMATKHHLLGARNYIKVLKMFIEYMGHEVPLMKRYEVPMVKRYEKFFIDFTECDQDKVLGEALYYIVQLQDFIVVEGIEIPNEGIPLDVFLDDNGWPKESLSRRNVCLKKSQGYETMETLRPTQKGEDGSSFSVLEVVKPKKKIVKWKEDIQVVMGQEITAGNEDGKAFESDGVHHPAGMIAIKDVAVGEELGSRPDGNDVDDSFVFLMGATSDRLMMKDCESTGTNFKSGTNF